MLKGTVEMIRLRIERGEAPRAGTLQTIADQVERLESYAAAMGGIAKLEDRKVVRDCVPAGDLARMLMAHAQEFVGARRSGLALSFDAAGMGKQMLSVDRSLVDEVLGNVLSNACGHARSRVAMACALDGDCHLLAITVTDDGPGFTEEALRRGCEPFYGEAKDADHFGLGLNIVRILTRLHGGDVALANTEAGGASVTVTFAVDDALEE